MPLTTSTITGQVLLPTGSAGIHAEVEFRLNTYGVLGEEVVIPGPVRVTLEADGSLPEGVELWQNIEGLTPTFYIAEVIWYYNSRTDGGVQRKILGRFLVGAEESYTLAELIGGSYPNLPAGWWVGDGDGLVQNSMLSSMPEGTIKGRNTGSGGGAPEDLTPSQVRAVLELGSSSVLDAGYFATAEQGERADSAVQPGDSVSDLNETDIAKIMTGAERTKLAGIEPGADITDTTNVMAAGALMDSEVASLSGIKSLVVPDNATITPTAATLLDDTTTGAMRTTLGLGALAIKTKIAFGDVEDGALTNAYMASFGEGLIKGRASGAGAGAPQNLTADQVRTIINVQEGSNPTNSTTVGAVINGVAAKATPVDADVLPLIDSAASNVLKKVTLANLLSSTARLTGAQTIAGVKTFTSAPVVPDASFSIAKTSGLQAALDDKATAAQGAKADTAVQPGDASAASDGNRPGRAMAAWVVGIAGAPASKTGLDEDASITSASVEGLGECAIVTNADKTIARREAFPVHPGRVYVAFFVARRTVDTEDISGAGMQFGLGRMGYQYSSLGNTIFETMTPFVTTGIIRAAYTFSVGAPALGTVDKELPSSTVQVRQYIRSYGLDKTDAIAQMQILDVTEAASIAGALDAMALAQAVLDAEAAVSAAEAAEAAAALSAAAAAAAAQAIQAFADRDAFLGADIPADQTRSSWWSGPLGTAFIREVKVTRNSAGAIGPTLDGGMWSPSDDCLWDHYGYNAVMGTTDMGPAVQAAHDAGERVVKGIPSASYRVDTPCVFFKNRFSIDMNEGFLNVGTTTDAALWFRSEGDPTTPGASGPSTCSFKGVMRRTTAGSGPSLRLTRTTGFTLDGNLWGGNPDLVMEGVYNTRLNNVFTTPTIDYSALPQAAQIVHKHWTYSDGSTVRGFSTKINGGSFSSSISTSYRYTTSWLITAADGIEFHAGYFGSGLAAIRVAPDTDNISVGNLRFFGTHFDDGGASTRHVNIPLVLDASLASNANIEKVQMTAVKMSGQLICVDIKENANSYCGGIDGVGLIFSSAGGSFVRHRNSGTTKKCFISLVGGSVTQWAQTVAAAAFDVEEMIGVSIAGSGMNAVSAIAGSYLFKTTSLALPNFVSVTGCHMRNFGALSDIFAGSPSYWGAVNIPSELNDCDGFDLRTLNRWAKDGRFGIGTNVAPEITDFTAELFVGEYRYTESTAIGLPTSSAFSGVARVSRADTGRTVVHISRVTTSSNFAEWVGVRTAATGTLTWKKLVNDDTVLNDKGLTGDTTVENLSVTGDIVLGGVSMTPVELNLSDDSVATVVPVRSGGFVHVTCHGHPGAESPVAAYSGVAWVDLGLTVNAIKNTGYTGLSANFLTSTTDLDETTATDGNVTLVVQPGLFKIINRTGAPRTFQVFMF